MRGVRPDVSHLGGFTMRSTVFTFIALAGAAVVSAAGIAGCQSSASGVPLPGPSLAPILCGKCVTEYPVPTANATPFGVALGADGNMWFTEFNGNKVGVVTPAGGYTEIPLPTANSQPENITAGPNNSVWFVETGSSKIGAVNVNSHTLTEYATPTGNAAPTGIATDPTSANRLWFGEFNAGAIGEITSTGAITEYPDAISGSAPTAVAVTSNGTIWFLDFGTNTLDSMTLPGPVFAQYGMPATLNGLVSGLSSLTVGPDGNLWFTAYDSDSVAVADVNDNPPVITAVTPPSDDGGQFDTVPIGIVSDPSRDVLWFAEAGAGQLAKITTGGVITEYGIPGNGTTAVGVALGPDVVAGSPTADVWFTDSDVLGIGIGTNQMGKANVAMFPASSVRRTFKANEIRGRMRLLGIHLPGKGIHIKP
jgi:streptogramin lyase